MERLKKAAASAMFRLFSLFSTSLHLSSLTLFTSNTKMNNELPNTLMLSNCLISSNPSTPRNGPPSIFRSLHKLTSPEDHLHLHYKSNPDSQVLDRLLILSDFSRIKLTSRKFPYSHHPPCLLARSSVPAPLDGSSLQLFSLHLRALPEAY